MNNYAKWILHPHYIHKAAIIRAEGEATAAKMISRAMQVAGNGLIEVRRIDAAVEVANTLSRSKNITYLPQEDGKNGLLLQVGDKQ